MSSPNYDPNLLLNDRSACDTFSLLLMFNISCMNYFGFILNNAGFLVVSSIFTKTGHIESAQYYENSSFTINCPSSFSSDVHWIHAFLENGELKSELISPNNISYHSESAIISRHRINIERATKHTAGAYTCFYRKNGKYWDYTTKIQLNEGPEFGYFEQNIYASEHKSITIQCNAGMSNNEKITVYWKRKDIILKPSQKYRMISENNTHSLTINNLRREDRGWYFCCLKTQPEKRKRIVLYIKSLPELSPETEVLAIHEGKNLSISCPGQYRKRVKLVKITGSNVYAEDVQSIFPAFNGPVTFSMTSLTPADDGYYQCFISVHPYRIEKQFLLVVIEKRSKLLSKNQEKFVFRGNQVELRCESTARSYEKIIWYKKDTQTLIADGDVLSNAFADRFTLKTDENSSTLTITPVNFFDSTTFVCKLNREIAEIKMNVRVGPLIYGCSYDKLVPTGEDVTFECHHQNSHGLKMNWFFNNEKINDDHSKFSTINSSFISSLIVKNLQLSDSGNYSQCFDAYDNECIDHNLNSFYSIPDIYLSVTLSRNELQYDIRYEHRSEGEDIEMTCQLHPSLGINEFCWLFPDGSFKPCRYGYSVYQEYTISSDQNGCSLSIRNLLGDWTSNTHSGTYTCRLICSNTIDEEQNIISYILQVTSGPKFVYEGRNTTAFIGYEYTLVCDIGEPDGRKVDLLKKVGNDYISLMHHYLPVNERFQLTYLIPVVSENHQGEYIWKFSSSAQLTYEFNEMKTFLSVMNPPNMTAKINGEQLMGEKMSLECNVSNMERYQRDFEFEWYRGGENESHLISIGNTLLEGNYHYEISNQNNRSILAIQHAFENDCEIFLCKITTFPKFARILSPQCNELEITKKEPIFGAKGRNLEIKGKCFNNSMEGVWFVERNNYFINIKMLMNETQEHLPQKYEISNQNQISKLQIINATLLDSSRYILLCPRQKINEHQVEILDPTIMTVDNITVREGQGASLTCNIQSKYISKASWIYKGKKFRALKENHTLIEITQSLSHSITINFSFISRSDQGTYYCSIEDVPSGMKKAAQITVLE